MKYAQAVRALDRKKERRQWRRLKISTKRDLVVCSAVIILLQEFHLLLLLVLRVLSIFRFNLLIGHLASSLDFSLLGFIRELLFFITLDSTQLAQTPRCNELVNIVITVTWHFGIRIDVLTLILGLQNLGGQEQATTSTRVKSDAAICFAAAIESVCRAKKMPHLLNEKFFGFLLFFLVALLSFLFKCEFLVDKRVSVAVTITAAEGQSM